MLDPNVLENNPSCRGNSFFIIANKDSEDRMNPEVLPSQTNVPQIPELCDTPQICKERFTLNTAASLLKTYPVNLWH